MWDQDSVLSPHTHTTTVSLAPIKEKPTETKFQIYSAGWNDGVPWQLDSAVLIQNNTTPTIQGKTYFRACP